MSGQRTAELGRATLPVAMAAVQLAAADDDAALRRLTAGLRGDELREIIRTLSYLVRLSQAITDLIAGQDGRHRVRTLRLVTAEPEPPAAT